MATGIQTGIRTGSTPLPTGKGPGGGGIGKVLAGWSAMSTRAKVGIIAGALVLVIGLVVSVAMTSANKYVPLYATTLSPTDVQEIGRRLNENNIPYSIEGGKIMVHPSKRSSTIGMLLGFGLPHRALLSAKDEGGMTPKTSEEKRLLAVQNLENELIDQIRQFDVVADAYVKLVPTDEDALPSERKPAKANVFLALKPGARPNKIQIEAILNLVAYSVPGLQPENVKVTDRTGFVWNDGNKIAAAPGGSSGDDGSFENENLAIKKAYEKRYQDKIQTALNQVLGQSNYTVTVDADIDFTQTKVETTQVGEPGGNNSVVSVVKKDVEKYNNNPKEGSKPQKAGSTQVGMPVGGADKGTDTNYEKVRYEQKVDTGKIQKTAIISPGVVKKVTASVMVNGKHEQPELAKIQTFVAAAVGLDASRGDSVTVNDYAFTAPATEAANLPPDFGNRPAGNNQPMSPYLTLMVMVVPTAILLGVLAVFLIKQRRVQAEKTGLILTATTGATTSDISDLLSDKIGRSTAASQTTKVNNTEQLEKLAKEKPTKVAELLKSTWLSDKER